MSLRRILTLLCLVFVAMMPVAAWAHGDAVTTDPADGARVAETPSAISIDFSEPPTKDNRFTVLDGCGDDVLTEVTGEGTNRSLQIAGGSPGRWEVTYTVISATDGHETHDRFTFTVKGKRDCSNPTTDESPDIGDKGVPVEPGLRDSSSFPVAPILIGGAVILVLAVAVRVLSSR